MKLSVISLLCPETVAGAEEPINRTIGSLNVVEGFEATCRAKLQN